MRAVILSCVLLLVRPAVSLAEDDPAGDAVATAPAQPAGLPKAQLEEVVDLIDAWLQARDQDEQIRLQGIDEELTYWCRSALQDPSLQAAMAPSGAPAEDSKAARRKRRKKESRRPSEDLPSMDDLMDTSLRVDSARLGALTRVILDAQPRFARMEATGVDFIDKERKLKELRGLARAELAAGSEPPVPVAPKASVGGAEPDPPVAEDPGLEDSEAGE